MSMAGYTKLFNSILASTIWRSSDTTRIVWITLLAMADKDGIAEGSIPGLADMARVSLEDCETALEELSAPDKYSRTSDHEGRRIEAIDGVGWRLLNHDKYRQKMSADERREYNRTKQREYRERQKSLPDVIDSQSQSAMCTHTEADTEADTEEEKSFANAKSAPEPPKPDNDNWLETLKTNPLYTHVDLDRELRKAQDWIADHPNRRFTLKFFKNWINKIEPPLSVPAKPSMSEEEIKGRAALLKSQEMFLR